MKKTWFYELMVWAEDLTFIEQNTFIVHASNHLGDKICKFWDEDYSQIRAKYNE